MDYLPWGKYGIHGTIYPWFIGRSNESDGCIRMLNKDAKDLYDIVPYGATVTVVQNKRPFRTMKDGDIGSDILEMQLALKKLGYYQGYPDGKFGENMQACVKKFQKANKLHSTGIINTSTYALIIKQENTSDDLRQ